jgi:hypothetical protein
MILFASSVVIESPFRCLLAVPIVTACGLIFRRLALMFGWYLAATVAALAARSV